MRCLLLGQDDDQPRGSGSMPLSHQDMLHLKGSHQVSRAAKTIQSGMKIFCSLYLFVFLSFCFFFSLVFCLLSGERLCHFSPFMYMCVVDFQDLAEQVDNQLSKHKVKKYSSRNHLHKRMLGLNPLFREFVSGPKNGRGTHFYCKVCKRDVAMKAHSCGEFGRQLYSPSH